jgi:6-phosphofructo-2-kinase/fructose-2,6-biphosphatase 2/6-phosphofructo-2-kinase/fructose-2,6-biphosphatase 4
MERQKLIVGMCGLPARGKTFVARKLMKYLKWCNISAKVFNIGNYRRQECGTSECTAEFFDPNNKAAKEAREKCAILALEDMLDFLANKGGFVGIYDGTNSTKERRKKIRDMVRTNQPDTDLIWVECICDDENFIDQNIRKAKLSSPDYIGQDPEVAVADFKKRIEKYKLAYQPIESDEYAGVEYIKSIDMGRTIRARNVCGYLQTRILTFLGNVNVDPRPIYLVRTGETVFDKEKRRGGDSELSDIGRLDAEIVMKILDQEIRNGDMKGMDPTKVRILTGTRKHCREMLTALKTPYSIHYLKILDDLDLGVCDGMLEEEIEKKFPLPPEKDKHERSLFSYPRGESYIDLVHRLEPVMMELERTKMPIIVIADCAVLKCLYAYLSKHEIDEVESVKIPQNSLLQLKPDVYYNKERHIIINPTTGEIVVEESQKIPPLILNYKAL